FFRGLVMQNAKVRLEPLSAECQSFDFVSVGNKNPEYYAFLRDLSPEWISFVIRVDDLTLKLFGSSSELYKKVHAALKVDLIGSDEAEFVRIQRQLQGALASGIALVDDLPATAGSA